MAKTHHYETTITWTGNKGQGTSDYREYERSHTVSIHNKADIYASSDTPFRGDASKHNPEDFLLSALSSCHMLWYLHLCADAGVVVVTYTDTATAVMEEKDGGGGCFSSATLHPVVTVSDASMVDKANALHEMANKKCFIANSCNFPVRHVPVCHVQSL